MKKITTIVLAVFGVCCAVCAMPVRSNVASKESEWKDSDIVRVEYLESTVNGKQYVFVPVPMVNDLEYEISAAATAWTSSKVLFGGRNPNMYYCQRVLEYSHDGSNWLCLQRYSSPMRAEIPFDFDFHVYRSSKYECSIDGVVGSTANVLGNDSPFCLFAQTTESGAGGWSPCRIAYAKFWLDGELVCDLVPVRRGGVGYMLDTVSGELLGNMGEGEFLFGPDVE